MGNLGRCLASVRARKALREGGEGDANIADGHFEQHISKLKHQRYLVGLR